MKFISTRNKQNITLSQAINQGIALDGGLFIPEKLSKIEVIGDSYQEIAVSMLKPFFQGDQLAPAIENICSQAFNFPCELTKISNQFHLLELFHGPTAAFKDYGARFLAQCFATMPEERIILVATSGDTGGAVAAAFDGVKNTKVILLFPKGGISPLQEHQLTCWSENITSLRVSGTFDDCQKLVKEAFSDQQLKESYHLTSANSINIARLLPQMTYYAYSSLKYKKENGVPPNYIIPTGNMGNSMACFWAKKIGLPIGKIILATNANDIIPQAITTGSLAPKESIKTLANAMDVGNPSNFARYSYLNPEFKNSIETYAISDEEIKTAMLDSFKQYDLPICPHTATAYHVWKKHKIQNAIVVATADPAKFSDVSKPLNIPCDMPETLSEILKMKTQSFDIAPSMEDLKKYF